MSLCPGVFPITVAWLLWAWALMVGSFGVGLRPAAWVPKSGLSSDPGPVTQQLLMVSTCFL